MIFNASTYLYGVIGNPVKHSASPRLFNQIFRSRNYNGVYLAFENSSIEKIIMAMRTLSINGFSVTIPFKEEVTKYIDEWDNTARTLGCVNTVWNNSGHLIGYNFDGQGALSGLEGFSNKNSEVFWSKSSICFLGNGGAARGILLSLISEPDFSGQISIVARNLAKTEKLISDAHAIKKQAVIVSYPWGILQNIEKFKKLENPTIIINTTSIGMFPKIDISPVKSDFWDSNMVAYDIVYNPLWTQFLKDAKKSGAKTITGLNMFLGQARLQLKTWTGWDISLSEIHSLYQMAITDEIDKK